jgi:hypothetical protein
LVAASLHVNQCHNRDETTYVKGCGGGIKAYVARHRPGEQTAQIPIVGYLFDKSALLQDIQNVFRQRSVFP